MKQLAVLRLLMMASTFYTGAIVGTRARDIKTQIRTTEHIKDKEELKQQFSIIHRQSMILNVLICEHSVNDVRLVLRTV